MKIARLCKMTLVCIAPLTILVGTSSALAGGSIAAGFYDLGVGVIPKDVSTDGTLAGGEAGTDNAFLWTQADGQVDIGGDFRGVDWYNDDGYYSGVTTNTVLMAGRADDNHTQVWFGNADGTGTDTWYGLPPEGGANAWLANGTALGVAPDSSNYWVAGYREDPSRVAVRYKHSSKSSTAIGGPASGGDLAEFDGASNNGYFAGRRRDNTLGGKRRAMYYSGPTGSSSIWLDINGTTESEANYLSPDGRVAVGWDRNQPTWWGPLAGESTTEHFIPLLPGETYGEATGTNEDGSIIVGWSFDGTTRQNWIWDDDNGTREIGAFLASEGITVPAGFNFDASGNQVIMISGGGYDDLTIVGDGDRTTGRGYVVHLGTGTLRLGDMNGDGNVDNLDVDPFLEVLLNGPFNPAADMTGDGLVNGLDVDLFVAEVRDDGGAVAIPEPSTVSIVVIGILSLFACGRRRRNHVAS